jgi:hypothetical protein
VRSDVSIGDVIRAWRALDAQTDDERREIARLLGFELRDAAPGVPMQIDDGGPAATPPPEKPAIAYEPREPRKETEEVAVPLELVPFTNVHDERRPLPPKGIERPSAMRPRPLDSLFAAGWARAIAGTLTARIAPLGALDIPRTIDLLVQRRPIRRLPRRKRLVSATEIVVVIDRRGTIAWFRDDADQLIEKLNGVTRSPVGVTISDGIPALSSAAAADRAGVRIGPCGRVIAITDLGHGSSTWTIGDSQRAEAWLDFALQLRGRDASLAIVTPVPMERVPSRLQRAAACVHWDGRTRPGLVHKLVKGMR